MIVWIVLLNRNYIFLFINNKFNILYISDGHGDKKHRAIFFRKFLNTFKEKNVDKLMTWFIKSATLSILTHEYEQETFKGKHEISNGLKNIYFKKNCIRKIKNNETNTSENQGVILIKMKANATANEYETTLIIYLVMKPNNDNVDDFWINSALIEETIDRYDIPNKIEIGTGLTALNDVNALIQIFAHSTQFFIRWLYNEKNEHPSTCECIICILAKIIHRQQNSTKPFSAKKLCEEILKLFKIDGCNDSIEDAHKLYLTILKNLRKELKNKPSKVKSFDEIFMWKIESWTTCTNCQRTSERKDEIHESFIIKVNSAKTGFQDRCEGIFHQETLDDACKNCKKMNIIKMKKVKEFPKILALELKYSKPNELKQIMDIIQFQTPKTTYYSLFGNIKHIGKSLEEGYYISRIRNDSKTYTLFDNEKVSTIDTNTAKQDSFMLFYKKIETGSIEKRWSLIKIKENINEDTEKDNIYALNEGTTKIGKNPNCNIIIEGLYINDEHCEINIKGDIATIKCLV